jgi:ABC-type bacteriocin/lantibiotic exporter with double-glycine peptidase domain
MAPNARKEEPTEEEVEEIAFAPADRDSRLRALFQRFPWLERLGVPFRRRVRPIRQTVATECGAACLTMILDFHGRTLRLDEVRDALGVGRDGATALALLQVAESYGLRGRGVKVGEKDEELEYLSALGLPAILFWQFRHFVVFERLGKEGVHVVDPAFGRVLVPPEEFRKSFTGVALLFEPTDAFEQKRAPKSGVGRYLRSVLRETRLLPRIGVLSTPRWSPP